jgi:hypothetical protein
MTYEERVDALTEASRKKIHEQIDALTETTRQTIYDGIDNAVDEFAKQQLTDSQINKLCKRPSYVTNDFIWRYYPLVLGGSIGIVLFVAAVIVYINK